MFYVKIALVAVLSMSQTVPGSAFANLAGHGMANAVDWPTYLIPVGSDITMDDHRALVGILVRLGYLSDAAMTSLPGDERVVEALKKYQTDHDLPVTGVLDEDTFYSVTDQWRFEK